MVLVSVRECLQFASKGHPNQHGELHWPALRGPPGKVQRLASPISAERVPAIERLQVFDRGHPRLRGKALRQP